MERALLLLPLYRLGSIYGEVEYLTPGPTVNQWQTRAWNLSLPYAYLPT